MKYLLIIVLLFSFSQARAEQRPAGFFSGNALLEICEAYLNGGTSANIAKGNACHGYVASIADAHGLFVGWEMMEQVWCFPEKMKVGQLVRIATKYLQENPEELHLIASSLVAIALIKAFPCE